MRTRGVGRGLRRGRGLTACARRRRRRGGPGPSCHIGSPRIGALPRCPGQRDNRSGWGTMSSAHVRVAAFERRNTLVAGSWSSGQAATSQHVRARESVKVLQPRTRQSLIVYMSSVLMKKCNDQNPSIQKNRWLTIALSVKPEGALIDQLQGRPDEA